MIIYVCIYMYIYTRYFKENENKKISTGGVRELCNKGIIPLNRYAYILVR